MRKDRMAWTRTRTCLDCGKVEEVRRDNAAPRCAPCARRLVGEGLRKPKQRTFSVISRFRGGRRLQRVCETCRARFEVYESSLRSSNSTGRFCSAPCYHEALRKRVGRRTAMPVSWVRTAKAHRASNPFCAICGRRLVSLDVHHLLPRRHGGSDDPRNLITLCERHHGVVEKLTREIILDGGTENVSVIVSILRFRQHATQAYLQSLQEITRHG